jgi:hypothetical protein
MKAGIANTEKIAIARQRHGKHVSAVKNKHATIEELLEAVPRQYKENQLEF